ncbi:MAG: hypothetical protein WAM58_14695 [Candidatus Acidiferrum sp.]
MFITKSRLKVADEVWLSTALLHRDHPDRSDFSIEEIVERAAHLNLHGSLRPGVYVHVVQHCVANRAPNPGRYRMLFETDPGRRRLFRKGDPYHPDREGTKITPDANDLPNGYADLLPWYEGWCESSAKSNADHDAILALAGSGRELWADEHADDYVRRLREGWE